MSDAEITNALKALKRIAVVGLSPDTSRASYRVSRYLIQKGYEVTGVRPGGQEPILGRPCYAKLADVPGSLEIVDVFRKSEAVAEVVDEVLTEMDRRPVEERPKLLWLQEGVTDSRAEARAKERGLWVISDRCLLKEHARLLG